MTDKITDFLETIKETGGQMLPVEKETMQKNLQEVPDEIMSEYIQAVEAYIEDLLVCKNVVTAINSPNLYNHLLKDLDQTQLAKLNNISLHLASKDPFERIREIRELTFGIVVPTQESFDKSVVLIALIKSLDVDYDAEAKRLATTSRDLRFLADIFGVLNLGKQFESIAPNRLAELSEDDLDRLKEIVHSMVENN